MPSKVDLPKELQPSERLTFELSSGHAVDLPKATPAFELWHGALPGDTYGGKTVLDVGGEPVFAEIAILRLLQRTGWSGVWVDTFRRTYRRSYWREGETITLPEKVQRLIDTIEMENGSASGCFDVCAWTEVDVLFAEAKRKGHDRIRQTQKRWIDSALKAELPLDALLVVEWSIRDDEIPPK